MNKMPNQHRRRFLQYSALGAAATAFPGLLQAQPGQIKSYPTPGFKADVEIELTARKAYIPILEKGANTNVQKYYAKLLKGPETTLLHLKRNYLGPVLHFVKGQKVRIFFNNALMEPCITHWHGLHVPQKSDGHPMYSILPGERYVYEFEVLNRAGTSFYHSHTHELTAEQVYKGLAGMITVTDDQEQALELPDGEYDLPLVIQDRTFNDKNQLQYLTGMHGRMMGFLGDTILVNGRPNMEFKVKSRAYRFRALNGSNSRIYKLGWDDGTPLTAIGTDAGLLEKPVTLPYVMLGSGERVDLWLDFSGRESGSKLVMKSLPFSGAMPPMYERMMKGQGGSSRHGGGMGMMGGMNRMGGGNRQGGMQGGMGMGMMSGGLAQGAEFPIATFHVTEKVSDSPKLPGKLVAFQRLTEKDADNADHPIPIGISMKPMAPLLNGKSFQLDEVFDFEKVPLNSIKKIKIFHDHGSEMAEHGDSPEKGGMKGMGGGMRHGGGMGMMGGMNRMGGGDRNSGMQGGGMSMGMMMSMAHPIHLHGQQYQILSRKMEGMRKAEYDTVKDGFIDAGWKDTVLVMPGEEIEIIKPFEDYTGLFLYHCHNLEHEDMGMMRNFLIT